jgi:indole-3-glycerol phosphate synthase
MSDMLARICADKRREIAQAKAARPLSALERDAATALPPRGFIAALESALAAGFYALVGEIKRASPSRGLIRANFAPASLARAYARGGAACLSVLTDEPYFKGRAEHLVAARAAVDLPILRKDFMLDTYQVVEARAMGADAILLILAALEDEAARALEAEAHRWGMDVLAEVHDRTELERAAQLRTKLIGINNRNLKSLTVDLSVTEKLAPALPPGRLLLSESGIETPADLTRLARCGARCFLVGESLMRQGDVERATRALLTPASASRASA